MASGGLSGIERNAMVSVNAMNRWVSFDPELQNLDEFLAQWKPRSTLAPSVQWICVSRLKSTRAHLDKNRADNLMQAWSALCQAQQNSVTALDAQRLGLEHNVKSGKWLIYLAEDKVDVAWSIVANAVIAGRLGDDAKVSTNECVKAREFKLDAKEKPLKLSRKDKVEPALLHVICVYSKDIFDVDGIFELRGKLRDLGFTDRLCYKPDAYSFCGIYRGNMWKIPPIMYRAS